MNMDKEGEELVEMLLDGWFGALQNVDTLMQVVSDVPDWEKKVQYFQKDYHRIMYTAERFSPVRKTILSILHGEVSYSQLEQVLAAIEKKPD